jgi:hypothetical protein
MEPIMARGLIVFVMVPLLLGCGQSPAAKARAAADAKRHADHIAKLRSYVPENVLKTVGPEFYTYAGFRDWWRFPLVYPYSICCIDTLDAGHLAWYDGKSKISSGGAEGYVQCLNRLTEFSFDAHYLIGHMEEDESRSVVKNHDLNWVLFDFATGKFDLFRSKQELAAAAKARGYTGEMELASVKVRYEECFEQ